MKKESETSTSPKASRYTGGPRAPVRIMQVMEALAQSPRGVSLPVLAERLSIPKTSLLSHLRVLVETGHIAVQDARYVLGPSAFRLATIVLASSNELASLESVGRRLAVDSGETALIGVLDQRTRQAYYLRVIEGNQPVRFMPGVGGPRPLYCTAIGRALLAFQSDAFVDAYLKETKLERFNPSTVTNREKLKEILAQVRADHVTITMRQHNANAGAIASPVLDRNAEVRYALGLGLPADRLARDQDRLARLVVAAAQEASWVLGGPQAHIAGAAASMPRSDLHE